MEQPSWYFQQTISIDFKVDSNSIKLLVTYWSLKVVALESTIRKYERLQKLQRFQDYMTFKNTGLAVIERIKCCCKV